MYRKFFLDLKKIIGQLNSDDQEEFIGFFTPIMANRAISELQLINSPTLSKMLLDLKQLKTVGKYFYFKIIFDDNETSIGNRRGGVHRIRDILYMNSGNGDYLSYWNFVLIHELTHFLDKNLKNAALTYGTPKRVQEISNLLKKNMLTNSDINAIKLHIYTGLERGLIAEFRSWMLTILIYQESGLNNVLWLEDFLHKRPSQLPLDQYLFMTLKKRVLNPDPSKHYLFRSKVYMSLYDEVMSDFDKKLPSLGHLQRYLK